MNNTCKVEVDCEDQELLIRMMAEINRLRQENEDLKVENINLRIDNELLHNSIEQKYEESSQKEDLSYIDEYAKGNAEWDNLSLPKELGWKYEG